jgi:ribosomal silencing factor RsfS
VIQRFQKLLTSHKSAIKSFDYIKKELRSQPNRAQREVTVTPQDPAFEIVSREIEESRRSPVKEEWEKYSDEELIEKYKAEVEAIIEPLKTNQNLRSTPAQIFIAKNKDLLFERVAQLIRDRPTEHDDVEEAWKFYKDPVVRPPKGHLWGSKVQKNVSYVEKGEVVFSALIEFLQNEECEDVKLYNLETLQRRDLGNFLFIGTIASSVHGRRVAQKIRSSIEDVPCDFKYGKGDTWLSVQIGNGTVVHLMTGEERSRFDIEKVLLDREECHQMEDFPHYQ